MNASETGKPGINFRNLMLRVLASTAICLIVLGISIYVAWGNASNSDDCRWEQYNTRLTLQAIADSITAYRQKFGVSPHSFGDLEKFPTHFSPEDMAHPTDGWGHPMVLSTNTGKPVAVSYGRDGKPGGVGLDYDLTTVDQDPMEARPTFRQFLLEMPVKGMILSCYLCGGIAGLLGFFIINITKLDRAKVIMLVLQIIVMVLASVFMASIIAGLHIPAHEH